MMRRVGIKLLKNELSKYVRAAEAGETVLVTDRDRVVAELAPPRRRQEPTIEAVLARGFREGWYTPPEISHTEPVPKADGRVPFDTLMDDLARDREDR